MKTKVIFFGLLIYTIAATVMIQNSFGRNRGDDGALQQEEPPSFDCPACH